MRRCMALVAFFAIIPSISAQPDEQPQPDIFSPSPIAAVVPCEPAAPPPKEWTGGIDFGINGTEGNSQNTKLRAYAETKRERPDNVWTANVLYSYGMANDTTNENRMLFNTKYEWLFGDSPWSYFVSGGAEYDQFRAFDWLIFGHTGFGYSWWKDDCSFLKTRVGFGGSQQYGGPDDEFAPEMLLGADYERKIGDR